MAERRMGAGLLGVLLLPCTTARVEEGTFSLRRAEIAEPHPPAPGTGSAIRQTPAGARAPVRSRLKRRTSWIKFD